jgi:hypothetical protein
MSTLRNTAFIWVFAVTKHCGKEEGVSIMSYNLDTIVNRHKMPSPQMMTMLLRAGKNKGALLYCFEPAAMMTYRSVCNKFQS